MSQDLGAAAPAGAAGPAPEPARAGGGGAEGEPPPEVSVVLPCLNEADTLAACLAEARAALAAGGLAGEIVVADNGSSDASPEIAVAGGARLVRVAEPGYGSALQGAIAAARGRFVVLGDADASYDFGEVPNFVRKLREGLDLVQGCRLPAGGGRVLPGAMPLLHRWLGNPLFSRLARWWFCAPIHDVYCGLRGFRREAVLALGLRCQGMEYAVEMIVKASLRGLRLGELPVTLRPDKRRAHAPHLKTFRDGWRTLRFFLLFCPRWLFLAPGLFLVLAGLFGYALALPGLRLGRATFDAHTLLFASLALGCGFQALQFAFFAKTFAAAAGLAPPDPQVERLHRLLSLERGLALGALFFLAGAVLLLLAIDQWRRAGFGPLDYARTMRLVIPGATLSLLGAQTALGSFLAAILRLPRR